MENPQIATTKGGRVSVCVLPDNLLLEGYISAVSSSEDKELALLLSYAEPEAERAGAILRRCLVEGRKLVVVYPGLNETPPNKAQLIGDIPDGALYMV